MTTRTLHERAREHINAASKRTDASAFGDHYSRAHPQKTLSITFEIVKRVRRDSDLHLHIEEALAIKKLGPDLNRREEGIGNGFLI